MKPDYFFWYEVLCWYDFFLRSHVEPKDGVHSGKAEIEVGLVCASSQSAASPLCDPMEYSLWLFHRISQARLLGVLPFLLQWIFPTQWTELTSLCFLYCPGRFFTTDPPKKPRALVRSLYQISLNISLYEPVCCLNPFGKSLPATCKNNSNLN